MSILSDDYTRLTVETDEENPVTVAEITNDAETPIIPAEGYRVRLAPKYDISIRCPDGNAYDFIKEYNKKRKFNRTRGNEYRYV